MSDDGEGERAIAALNGRELDGRVLNINEARPKEARSGGGGLQQEQRRPSAEQPLVNSPGGGSLPLH